MLFFDCPNNINITTTKHIYIKRKTISSAIKISDLVGTPPFQVYSCDYALNNCQLVATLDNPVPAINEIILPNLFNNSPNIIVKIISFDGCETFKYLNCETFPAPTPTPSPTPNQTPTNTNTPTQTPTTTQTPTNSQTPTNTNTPTNTSTPTNTTTQTPTNTPTNTTTQTPTNTATRTQTPTKTPTQTPTSTPAGSTTYYQYDYYDCSPDPVTFYSTCSSITIGCVLYSSTSPLVVVPNNFYCTDNSGGTCYVVNTGNGVVQSISSCG